MAAHRDFASPCRHTDRVSLAKSRIEDAPHGYLWCRDVPLARTGTMEYGAHEVPIPPLLGNRSVVVERTEDEVFAPEAIESFRGMPITDDHPEEDVTADNWRQHEVGNIHNPRRGEGEHADCLVGDLLFKDSGVIAAIKARRKRQLSCGYDAKYADVRPGYGRQVEIRGNHVSLVDAGRAGSRIAIRDRNGNMPASKTRKLGLRDGFIKFFRAKDEAEREAIVKAMEGDVDPGGEGDDTTAGGGHHTTINITGAPGGGQEPPKPRDDAGDPPPNPEGKDMDEDAIKAICGTMIGEALDAKLAPMVEQMTAMAGAMAEMKTAGQATAEQVAAVAEAVEDITDPEDMATQDAVARAEVLKPGVKLPVMDSKPGSMARKTALTAFQRTTLTEAFASNPDARDVIRDAVGSIHPDFTRMSPSDVGILFRAASSAVRDARSAQAGASVLTFTPPPAAEGGRSAPITTAAAVQAANAKRWGR